MSGNAPLDRLRAQRMLEQLENLQGRGTELVSVYVPPGKAVSEVMTDLRNEFGTAVNIKSKTTRKNVQDALTKVMERLKLFKTIPPTGLAIFAGNIASNQLGVGDMQTFVIVPPEPITIYYYRCEHQFLLEPLFNMLAAKDVYGLVVIDSKEAAFGFLKGSRTENHQAIQQRSLRQDPSRRPIKQALRAPPRYVPQRVVYTTRGLLHRALP